MENIYSPSRKKTALWDIPASALQQDVCARLAAAAGISRLRVRDPIYELTENFNTVFDINAASLASKKQTEGKDAENQGAEAKKSGGTEAFKSGSEQNTGVNFASFENSPAQIKNGNFYSRFSQTALNNGKLSGAVMRDGGKSMFVSCVKRALGASITPCDSQKTLAAESAAEVPVQNFSARLQFNRCVYGAASIVVDSLITADSAMDLLCSLASDDAQQMLEGNEIDTYRQLFPFLSTDAEKAMLTEYRERLYELEAAAPSQETVAKRAVLKAGLDKTGAMINQKQQMKTAFMVKLRELLEQSRKAQALYSSYSFVQEVTEELLESAAPPHNDGDNKNNNGKDKNENSGTKRRNR